MKSIKNLKEEVEEFIKGLQSQKEKLEESYHKVKLKHMKDDLLRRIEGLSGQIHSFKWVNARLDSTENRYKVIVNLDYHEEDEFDKKCKTFQEALQFHKDTEKGELYEFDTEKERDAFLEGYRIGSQYSTGCGEVFTN